MQTAGLSDRELVPWVVCVTDAVSAGVGNVVGSVVSGGVRRSLFSRDSISEPHISDHLRFSLADLTALLAASVAAPSSLSATNFINCQE
jgi:hypothetical protein